MEAKANKIQKIHLTEEKATLFITLYAKALDYRSKNPILSDKKADEILNMIDYDFEKFKSSSSDNLTVVRAKQLDEWVNAFLKTNPNAVVLYLGCGLDTRVTRINPSQSVSWFDVDYPEVIELRKNFYSDQNNYIMLGSSVTDADWLVEIPKDRPVSIIAEGLLEYLTEDEVKTLLNRLTNYFSHGQISFDVMNSFAIKAGKASLKDTTGAEHKWAVDDLREVDKLDTKLKRNIDLPVSRSKYISNLPIQFRLLFRIMSFIPPFKTMLVLLQYQF
jgi:O-methyltransferase involved in polyketide biosynthesis